MSVKAKFKPESAPAASLTVAEARYNAGVYRPEAFETGWRYVSFGNGQDLVNVTARGDVVGGKPGDGVRLVRVEATAVTFTFEGD